MKTDRSSKIHWKAYSVPKLGNRPEENEDAIYPEIAQQSITSQAGFSCAIADGATQTSFSRIWARLLVTAAVKKYLPERLSELTLTVRQQWIDHIATLNLPWHAEEKVQQGSFSTLLWLSLKQSTNTRAVKYSGTWQSLAIGDSCLFQIRKNTLRTHFPPLSASDFKNHPLLLSTIPIRNEVFWKNTQDFHINGDWCSGDDFFLMTDALAAWFLHALEKGNLPNLLSEMVTNLHSIDGYTHWIQVLRTGAQIKNDDTSIIWIHIDDSQA